MPTPAKLISAVLMAVLAWWVADTVVRELLPEGKTVGRFREICAAVGLLAGWKVLGRAATGKMGRGSPVPVVITSGVATAAVGLILVLLGHSFYVMMMESLDLAYDAPGKAMTAWMEFLWNDTLLIADKLVLGTLFVGAAIIGMVAGVVGRTYR